MKKIEEKSDLLVCLISRFGTYMDFLVFLQENNGGAIFVFGLAEIKPLSSEPGNAGVEKLFCQCKIYYVWPSQGFFF